MSESTKTLRKMLPGLLVSLVMVAAILYFVDLKATLAAIKAANYGLLLIVFLLGVGWLLLRSSGDTGQLLSIEQIQYRWRRWRMRRRLRAVQNDDWRARSRDDDRPGPWLH